MLSSYLDSKKKRGILSWLNPWAYSVSAQNFVKGVFAVLFLGAITGGLGYVLGGLQGLYWSIGLVSAFTLGTVSYSRELVFFFQSVKPIAERELVEGYDLHAMVEKLMQKPDINLAKKPLIGIMESEVLNAFATGPHPGHAGVAVTRGILKKARSYAEKTPYSAEELIEAILAHELGHVVHRDISIGAITSMLTSIAILINNQLYESNYGLNSKGNVATKKNGEPKNNTNNEKSKQNYLGVLLIPALYIMSWGIQWLIQCTAAVVSRSKETHADEMAFHCGYGDVMQHALRMLESGVLDPENKKSGEIEEMVSKFEGGNAALFCHHHTVHTENHLDQKSEKKPGYVMSAYNVFKLAFATHPKIDDRVSHLKAMQLEKRAGLHGSLE